MEPLLDPGLHRYSGGRLLESELVHGFTGDHADMSGIDSLADSLPVYRKIIRSKSRYLCHHGCDHGHHTQPFLCLLWSRLGLLASRRRDSTGCHGIVCGTAFSWSHHHRHSDIARSASMKMQASPKRCGTIESVLKLQNK